MRLRTNNYELKQILQQLRLHFICSWTKITLAFQYVHLYYSLHYNTCVPKLLLYYFYFIESSRNLSDDSGVGTNIFFYAI